MIKYIENIDEFNKEIKSPLVLLDFFASWCGPCKMLSPLLEELSNKHNDLTILKVDVDKNMDIASKYGIQSIPTLFLFKNGELIRHTLGYQNMSQLENFIS